MTPTAQELLNDLKFLQRRVDEQRRYLVARKFYKLQMLHDPKYDARNKDIDDSAKHQMNFFLKRIEELQEGKNGYEASLVQCDLCAHTWTAVRPAGLIKLECPNCSNMVHFEDIKC